MMPKLTKCELERPRTACELHKWVQRIHDEFGETREGKRAVWFRDKPCPNKLLKSEPFLKVFSEEVWPLANYAWRFFQNRSDVRFQPVIGNQSYDALLVDKSGSTLKHFEIVQTLHGKAGDQDRLRREHLDRYGHAPLTGPPLERTPDSKGVVENWGGCVKHSDAVAATIRQIRTAIECKASKLNRYSDDTALIVEFQGIFIQLPKDQLTLDEEAKSTLCGLASGFSELALIDDVVREGDAVFGLRYPTPGKPAGSGGAMTRSP